MIINLWLSMVISQRAKIMCSDHSDMHPKIVEKLKYIVKVTTKTGF